MTGRDAKAVQAELAGDRRGLLRRCDRIRRAHVGDDADVLLRARAEDGAHARLEQRVEAGVGVAAPGLLRERDRPLGQALEHQHIERAVFGELDRGFDAVAGVAGAGTETKGSAHVEG
jgi:hypothetical protein